MYEVSHKFDSKNLMSIVDRMYTVAEFTRFYSAFPTSTDQPYNVIVSSSPAVLFTNQCTCLLDFNITYDTRVRDLSDFIYSLKIFSVTCHRVANSLDISFLILQHTVKICQKINYNYAEGIVIVNR